jgi:hypothetical protein
MDNGTGLSASDVALLNGNNNAWGDNGFMWIFALLILAGGGFNWGGNGFANAIGYNNLATQNDVQRGFDNQNLQAQSRDILGAVTAGTAQSVAATNQSFHDIVSALSDKYTELQRDIAAVGVQQAQIIANQNDCCGSTKMLMSEIGSGINANIAQSRYDAALNTAAINANTTAMGQKILDAISQNKIDALQSKVAALELQNATANVVRYPNALTYNAGNSPFCNCGCSCGM